MQHENLQGQRMADTDYVMCSHNDSNYHQQEGCMQCLEGGWIRANPLHAVVSKVLQAMMVPLYNGDTQESRKPETNLEPEVGVILWRYSKYKTLYIK